MELPDKKILITGGSSGIGKTLIKKISKKSVTNIAVMERTADKLDDVEEQFPSIQLLKIQGDISYKKSPGISNQSVGLARSTG